MNTELIEETDEQKQARIREWRTRAALRDAPDIALHVRSLATRGKTERGETLPEWTAPMQITAADDVDSLYAQLVNWAGYWAEILETDPPAVTIVAWSNFREVQGFRAGTTPEGARSLVHLNTMWLLLKADRIREHPAVLAYQENVLEIMSMMRGRYPMAPRPERPVSPRPCPACGSESVHAEWAMGAAFDLAVSCWHCGYVIPEQQVRKSVRDWLV